MRKVKDNFMKMLQKGLMHIGENEERAWGLLR